MPTLERQLEDASQARSLLVASDFDGTLAPLVETPGSACADSTCMEALSALAVMQMTYAAIISGRAVADLKTRTGSPPGVRLVGSHGAESVGQTTHALSMAATELLQHVQQIVNQGAKALAGAQAESKPYGVALHYRNAHPEAAAVTIDRVGQQLARWPGIHAKRGNMVIEWSVVPYNKGLALRHMRENFVVTTVVFLGDDETDEDAFAILREGDLGIKVGDGPTRADQRIGGIDDVAQVLMTLQHLRSQWLSQSGLLAWEQLRTEL